MKRFIANLVLGTVGTIAGLAAPLAQAQDFPSKPIHLVIPAAAGGSTDIIGRILAKSITERYGVSVIVENKAGASGSIGVHAVVQAPPDGYTLLVSTPDAVTVFPLVTKNAPYVTTDLTPITLVASTPYVFAINAQLPAKTMEEFMALSKTQPLAMATPGSGSSGRIVLEMFKQRAGIDLLHVPYKGAGPALQSVIAGETHIAATSPVTLRSFVESGKLRALAISTKARSPVMPNVPTMIDLGFDDFDVAAWFGVFAPLGVPASVAEKLDEMVRGAASSPEYVALTTKLGLGTEPVSRDKFGAMLAAETERWQQLIESANIRSD